MTRHAGVLGIALLGGLAWPLAAASGPARFYTVSPCRAVDTRLDAGPLSGPVLVGGWSRTFAIAGTCATPATATALAANVTVVAPDQDGFLRISPAEEATPSTSAIHYRAGRVRANNAILASTPAGVAIFCDQPSGGAHVVIDVVGYFAPVEGATLTSLTVEETSGAARTNVPFTTGHVFAPGHVPAGKTLAARSQAGVTVPLQVDAKARHADGSLRHAVLTGRLAALGASSSERVDLVTTDVTPPGTAVTLADLLSGPFDAEVRVTTGGTTYSASARELLTLQTPTPWLEGPLVSEWLVSGPLSSGATQHPHLTARFEVRAYAGGDPVRVGITVENGWAFAASPQNFTTDVEIRVNGSLVYQRLGLTHLTHARWRKVFFAGSDPSVHVRLDGRYLIRTGAVPFYDPAVVPTEQALADLAAAWALQDTGPMGAGLTTAYMPTTGGRPDIGLLPAWAAVWVLSQDSRAARATLGTAELAGSFPVHYRNQLTGRPVSLDDFPYMTLLGRPGDTINPATGLSEAFPPCGGDCTTPYEPDSAHQPALAYLPYLVTGDAYFLDELHFWANWNMVQANPGYREHEQGLLHWDQTRGQAWSLRTLGHAAYITPDSHPLKSYFATRLANNLAWYVGRYVGGPDQNSLGVITSGYTIGYNNGLGLAPWQDDFFTQAVGAVSDLGFTQAIPLLRYKANFTTLRMNGPGFCWIFGASYFLNVRADTASPLYGTIAEVYAASIDPALQALPCGGQEMATALGLGVGEMTGYSYSPAGYPSNMQPALAAAVDSGIDGAAAAWALFAQRSVQPDHSAEPQFAIVPRAMRPGP